MNKSLVNALKNEYRRGIKDSSKACAVWVALALREEGFGGERIGKVLMAMHKYSQTVVNGVAIEEQIKHIESVTGLKIRWEEDDLTIEGLEDWEDYDK